MELPPPHLQGTDRWRPYRWPAVVVIVGLFLVALILALVGLGLKTLDRAADHAGQAGTAVMRQLGSIAEGFQAGRITQTFTASLPRLTASKGGRLELAKLEEVEIFRQEDERSLFWDTFSLGRTVSEIRVPVVYRYYLDLNDPWKIEVAGQTCLVTAPRIRPTLPPSILTDGMEKRSEAGWARFNAQAQLDALERSITPTLNRYAGDPHRIALVREPARRTVAEFIRTWLLREDHWRSDRFRVIKVVFADETALELDLANTNSVRDAVGGGEAR